MKSACLAADVLDKQLQQHPVDWQKDYVEPLQIGVETFRTFVTAWYEGGLQDVVFYNQQQNNIKQMICSILAGYVWDVSNPYVKNSQKGIRFFALGKTLLNILTCALDGFLLFTQRLLIKVDVGVMLDQLG